jgi:hypothetical protein
MKLCIDCAYFGKSRMCEAPENGISPVTGEPTPMFAYERRSAEVSILFPEKEKCGPDALHFVPKIAAAQKEQDPVKAWWRIW